MSTQPIPRSLKTFFISTFLVALVAASGFAGFYLGQSGRVSASIPGFITSPADPHGNDKKVDFSTFWQAWNVIDQNYYGGGDGQKQLEGAISGMVAGLGDPYTLYLPASASEIFQSDLQGNFGGVGAELTSKNGQVTVVAPLEGTPAEKAGLKAGDIIIEVDGKKTAGVNFNDVITSIRGEKGTTVKLNILHPGADKPVDITLTRDTITVKSVSSSSLGTDGSVAYIKVNQFGEDTTTAFQTALQDAKASGKKSLIVDLRNNPGGFVKTVSQMIGMVIPQNPSGDEKLQKRVALLERDKNGKETPDYASSDSILSDIPMVVLINGGSASASEIFAGAMRDYKQATLVGTKSFGKGSAQTLVPLTNKGSVKVTIAKWFSPLGVGIDGKGIEPDTTVELPDGVVPSTTDVQVAKALEILSKK